ncbi:LRR [Musa troglodytarum]|uniref:LRR n=1 Tax=Musa troglodytarum TaxID=320322 RepID=A0A9E7JCP8_9LILI|nr:LRR [Musa troglodytarum]
MKGCDLVNTFLPDELIMEIFRHVEAKSDRDACSMVCRKWRRLERACRRTIRIGASGTADQLVDLVVGRFTGLRNVFIDERLPVTTVQPQRSLPSKRKRHTLPKANHATEEIYMENELEQFCLSDAGLALLAKSCKGLEKLSFIWCSSITSLGLTTVAENCKFLKSVDLQGCYVGDKGLIALGQNCKQLEDLNLRFCEGLTDTGVVGFAQSSGSSLKSLGIAACAWISDVSLQAVASHCKFLENLSLDSELMRNTGVVSVAQGCRSLKALKLQCVNISDESLQAVGSYCSSLEQLALYSFQRFTDSDQSLEAIARGCTKLTNLEINGCHNIGTSGLEYIGRLCPYVFHLVVPHYLRVFPILFEVLRGLVELSLLYCPRMGNSALREVGRGCSLLKALHLVDCSSINDDGISAVAQGCRSLRKLHVRRCYEVGDKGIISVGENCKLLTDLSLRFCDRVGDEALVAVAEGCSLKHLNVSGCHLITDTGMTAIARGCPDLVNLDISVLQSIGDMALAELGHGCPLLKDIVLSHCRQITDVGLAHLVTGCSRLETCHMVYCPLVTGAGVATVVSSCANIKKVLVEKWKVSQRTLRRACSILSFLCVEL